MTIIINIHSKTGKLHHSAYCIIWQLLHHHSLQKYTELLNTLERFHHTRLTLQDEVIKVKQEAVCSSQISLSESAVCSLLSRPIQQKSVQLAAAGIRASLRSLHVVTVCNYYIITQQTLSKQHSSSLAVLKADNK